MVISIKNKSLYKRVFKKMDEYDKKALKSYKTGKMSEGKRFEKKSDNLYRNNYSKMFKISK